jgi:hypothetical protein
MAKKVNEVKRNSNLENIRTKYSCVINLKTSESEIVWNKYNAMLVINTIFIGFVGLKYNTGFSFSNFFNLIFLLVPIFGLFLCGYWWQITDRGYFWCDYWMDEANKLEKKIKGGENPVVTGKKRRNLIGKGLTLKVSRSIINIFKLIYFLLLIDGIISSKLFYFILLNLLY